MERLTQEKLLFLFAQGKTVEVRIVLNGGLFSRHELHQYGRRIYDFSYVDGSEYSLGYKQFWKLSFVAEAIEKGACFIEEVT